MKDDSFERAVNQIAAENEKHREREVEQMRRRELFAKIRKVGVSFFVLFILVSGFVCREELQSLWDEKVGHTLSNSSAKKDEGPGGAGAALADIQKQSAKRDALLDDLSKK